MEKIVLSGGSSGIGKALAGEFIHRGHEVFVFARSGKKLEQLEDEFSGTKNLLHVFPFDLRSHDFAGLAGAVKSKLGQVDCVVNNAGILVNKPFLELTEKDVSDIFRVNVMAVFPLVQHLFPLMKKGGHIVNISSMGGFQGSLKFAGLSAYSASKGALSVLTESMALELLPYNIHVNALALGAVQTDMLAAAFPHYTAPLAPAEIADFIVDFTLTGHRYFNGKILPVSLLNP